MRLRNAMDCTLVGKMYSIRFDGESKGSIGKIGGFTVRLKVIGTSHLRGVVLSIRSGFRTFKVVMTLTEVPMQNNHIDS
jgi:hypothetical protein